MAAALAEGALTGVWLSHVSLAWALAWFAGERTRLRRRQLAELSSRAEQAEREAERERLLAVAEERARIARDLHDSAGHAINVIAVRAGAARLRHYQEPDRSAAALAAIEELARETVAEIDHMVGALRDQGAGRGMVESPLGLASLPTLVAQHRATDLDISLDIHGVPRPLPAAADQAAYRILQEALTNAAHHGGGGAGVRVTFGDDAVELAVTNLLGEGHTPRPGGGHGLVGMRERAELLGGALTAERHGERFRLAASIPYRPARPSDPVRPSGPARLSGPASR